ncbi:MAG: imidazole glycerol phosphate synthase subunit HisH [Gemmatimonadaceae bacterium]
MISIVDYGLGNVQAFLNVFKRLNVEATTVTTADDLERATKVILPGVGHFDHAMERLQGSGMRETLDDLVMNRRVPVLGVCVGMQILARSSDEGELPGLGYIAGSVKGLATIEAVKSLNLPHMGWNDVRPTEHSRLFAELESDSRFYFLHSFFFECDRPQDVAAMTSYGTDFSSAVSSGNIYGVQFHPEKSHHFGTRLLKNFADL